MPPPRAPKGAARPRGGSSTPQAAEASAWPVFGGKKREKEIQHDPTKAFWTSSFTVFKRGPTPSDLSEEEHPLLQKNVLFSLDFRVPAVPSSEWMRQGLHGMPAGSFT